ncbi:MAG TPA: ABC transporter permease [Candidatus Nitrosopolaris sp.]|nr:ABC transporter permease [Candidatus Nitrosopolaris sp.]
MLSEARQAMGANRLRTFLTMLGTMIGVGAVIVMLAVGQGAQDLVDRAIASMGRNLLVVLAGSPTANGVRLGTGNVPTLTVADAQALEELSTVGAAAPILPGAAQIVYGAKNWGTSVLGTTPRFLDVRSWPLSAGSPFDDSDVRGATRVALLGQTVVKKLFGDEDPVGKTVRIGRSPYVVRGVLSVKGQTVDGREQDDAVLIPVTTAQRKLFGGQFEGSVRFLVARAASAEAMPAAERDMTRLLRQRHRLAEGVDNDFTIRNLTTLVNTAAETTRTMSLMLGAIASISLLVGGIGIMNIMLVSVSERTREIGIRCAVGARAGDIRLQFLLEALALSLVGCLLGVFLGAGGALLVSTVVRTAVVVTLGSILMAFLVAAGVGIFFGFYPANKAALLKPMDALRYQ